MKKTVTKINETLFKPYSENVLGYIARFDFSKHISNNIVINSNICEAFKGVVQYELQELSENNPKDRFILLQADFQIFKTENLKLTEMSESA